MKIEELSKAKILAYAEFYDYYIGKYSKKDENKIENEILDEVEKVNSINDLFELILKKGGILDWKGVLRIKRYFEEDKYWESGKKEDFLKEIKDIEKSITNLKDVVNRITSYPGIDFPIASTIVYFFSKGNCPIIDVRAVKTLRIYKYDKVKHSYDWSNYFDVCKKITEDNGLSFRQLDKALWIYPDIEYILPDCKKLNDLNLIYRDILDCAQLVDSQLSYYI